MRKATGPNYIFLSTFLFPTASFEPAVIVSTKENGNTIIKVRDNGSNISQKVLGKISQPFFTTKPTG